MFLVTAFAEVLKRRPEAVLLLAGDGELRPLIERWVNEHGAAENVRFLGQRDDIERLYQAFDAFVLPSLYEGLCLVGVEAQASGLPCLLADTITREVDVTGAVSFLSIDIVHPWVDAICTIRSRDNVECSNAGRSAFANYDIKCQSTQLMKDYLHLCEGAIKQ